MMLLNAVRRRTTRRECKFLTREFTGWHGPLNSLYIFANRSHLEQHTSLIRPYRGHAMASPVYRLFAEAMGTYRPVVCMYRGRARAICPVILGHSDGKEKALTYQFAGESNSSLPPGGQWRCLFLSEVSEAELGDGPWVVGSGHTQPQDCVKEVDLDVNPDSPYRPKRTLKRR
jgi:hypothetical protein